MKPTLDYHYFDTANYDNYERCKSACAKLGMGFDAEFRPTCCKKYHFKVSAYSFEQCEILTLMILACTAHAEQDKYKKKLAERVAKG